MCLLRPSFVRCDTGQAMQCSGRPTGRLACRRGIVWRCRRLGHRAARCSRRRTTATAFACACRHWRARAPQHSLSDSPCLGGRATYTGSMCGQQRATMVEPDFELQELMSRLRLSSVEAQRALCDPGSHPGARIASHCPSTPSGQNRRRLDTDRESVGASIPGVLALAHRRLTVGPLSSSGLQVCRADGRSSRAVGFAVGSHRKRRAVSDPMLWNCR